MPISMAGDVRGYVRDVSTTRREGSLSAEGKVESHWARALGVAAAVMLTSAVLASVASGLIQAQYPDRPTPPDLLFDLLPHWPS